MQSWYFSVVLCPSSVLLWHACMKSFLIIRWQFRGWYRSWQFFSEWLEQLCGWRRQNAHSSKQTKMFYFMLHFILVIGSFTWFMSTMDSIITVNSLHVQLFEQHICTISLCTESLIFVCKLTQGFRFLDHIIICVISANQPCVCISVSAWFPEEIVLTGSDGNEPVVWQQHLYLNSAYEQQCERTETERRYIF